MLKVWEWLGWLVAILSCVMLAKYGLYHGFVVPLERTLDYYEEFMCAWLCWAEPYLKEVLDYVLGWTGWRVHLYQHWKHVFLLMWLYFASDVATHWNFGAKLGGSTGRVRKRLAVSIAVWSGFVALAASTSAGLVALDDITSNTIMCVVVVAGFVMYEWGINALATTFIRDENESWWSSFRGHSRFPLQLAAAGAIVVLISTQVAKVPFVNTLPSPGMAILAVSVVALALYRVGVGALWTRRHRDLGKRWSEVFHLSISGPLGLRMLKVIGGAVLFILTNAGLKYVGL